MSTLTLGPRLFDPGGRLFDPGGRLSDPGGRLSDPGGRLSDGAGPTLDDVIAAGWGRITSGAAASCPVCHGELRPVWAAGPRPVAGRCQDCGSALS